MVLQSPNDKKKKKKKNEKEKEKEKKKNVEGVTEPPHGSLEVV
jgi:hypothetical protein